MGAARSCAVGRCARSLHQVRLELRPDVDGLDQSALRNALAAAGIGLDPRRGPAVGAWVRAALREAVENEPVPARQALSPRSTRGATRA